MTTNDILESALSYAALGWAVFPCQPRSKIPATARGYKDATTDEGQIRAWWASNPNYNVAIATGEVSGLFVLDIDHGSERSADDALAALPPFTDEIPKVRTGGGGLQLFFAYPAGHSLGATGGRLGNGIDTRGNGGYVVAPPSIHPRGVPYQWLGSVDLTNLPACPGWIVDRIEKQAGNAAQLRGTP